MSQAEEVQAWLAPGRLAVALEGSQRPASVALAAGGAPAVEFEGAGSHGADLLTMLAAELTRRSLGVASIERLVVGLGPGSFTGLRVVSAQAQGLARALGIEVLGLPSIEARLFAGLRPGQTGLLLADARGGLFTLGRYARSADDLAPLDPVAAKPAHETGQQLLAWAKSRGPSPTVRWFAEADAVPALGAAGAALPAFEAAPQPSAAALLHLAEARFAHSGAEAFAGPQPLYLAEFWVRSRT
jgi:tRNA threonylcarbamoyladenosine biosynthesis protein TsaB